MWRKLLAFFTHPSDRERGRAWAQGQPDNVVLQHVDAARFAGDYNDFDRAAEEVVLERQERAWAQTRPYA